LPDCRNEHRPECQLRIGKEENGTINQTEVGQEGIDDAVDIVVHPTPGKGGNDGWDSPGNKEKSTPEVASPNLCIEN
jgi:hypothetical protein